MTSRPLAWSENPLVSILAGILNCPREQSEEAVGTGQHRTLTPGFFQIEVGHGRKAIVIFVPVPLLSAWHKSQQR